MSVAASLLGAAVGVGLGARHAFEPDHLAAISVLAAERPGGGRGMVLGALWGVGHAATLLGWSAAVALAAPRISGSAAEVFELLVAAMLVALGVRAVRRAMRPVAGTHGHVHEAPRATRPLLIGALHGLAGSGALTAFVMLSLPTTPARLAFVALFGAGAALGMSLMSGLAGVPLARVMRSPGAARNVLGAVGAGSGLLGLLWGCAAIARLCG